MRRGEIRSKEREGDPVRRESVLGGGGDMEHLPIFKSGCKFKSFHYGQESAINLWSKKALQRAPPFTFLYSSL